MTLTEFLAQTSYVVGEDAPIDITILTPSEQLALANAHIETKVW